jgi:hypothetical protein
MITDCAAVDVLMCRSTNVYTIAASEGNAWMYEKTVKCHYTDHFTYDPDIYLEEVVTKKWRSFPPHFNSWSSKEGRGSSTGPCYLSVC